MALPGKLINLPGLIADAASSRVTRIMGRHAMRASPSGTAKGSTMPEKPPAKATTATAADIERSIQALNKMAERLWGEGREAEAKALLDALDALNRALDRIRIGENRRVVTLH